jgi:hypothetical protein
MTRNDAVINKLLRLERFYGTYRSKCRRNLRLYEYSPTLSIDNMTDDACVGYYQQHTFDINDDTTSSVQENVIRSCIDTLTSKIASQKVRPFINTVNGTFKQLQIAKQAQDFFDSLYDEQNINKIVSDAFRDACVFDRGVIYVDINDKKVYKVFPWQVYVDPREASYSRLTQLTWKQEEYPVSLLPIKVDSEMETVTYYQYWDLNKGKHYFWIPELDKYEEEKWDGGCLPFLFLNYASPVKATSSQSVVDLLYGVQMEIDCLLNKIKDASQLCAPMQYFVPEGSSLKATKITNRVGEVYTYSMPPNVTASPVTISTTPFMDPQWMQTVEALKQHAYEMVGISQLSATSQKPKGVNSGVALDTLEDIESDRFETQLNSVIHIYIDLAKLMIQLFPPEEDILPRNRMRSNIKWADIVQARDEICIQFSAANSLSKDPSTKLQQLQALYAAGLIPQSHIAKLMEMPDIDDGYNLATNSIKAVYAVIDDCIEYDNYEVPDYIPNQMLLEEIMNTILSLKAANNPDNNVDIQKLEQLYKAAMSKNIDAQTSAEMAATQTISNEIMADIQDPNGQINTAISGAQQQINADQQNTNTIGE